MAQWGLELNMAGQDYHTEFQEPLCTCGSRDGEMWSSTSRRHFTRLVVIQIAPAYSASTTSTTISIKHCWQMMLRVLVPALLSHFMVHCAKLKSRKACKCLKKTQKAGEVKTAPYSYLMWETIPRVHAAGFVPCHFCVRARITLWLKMKGHVAAMP